MDPWRPLSLDRVRTYSLEARRSKVKAGDFALPWKEGGSLSDWLGSLPHILTGQDFRELVGRFAAAVRKGRTVLLAMGAHPIKVGLSPLVNDLLERRILTGVALNGAGVIHDCELAMTGQTSEDVAAELGEGRFGMAEETGRFLNETIRAGAAMDLGLGQAVGRALHEARLPHLHLSILATAFRLGIPVTVHVAVGTDIIHSHPAVDGAAIGKTSHRDYLVFARVVSTLEEGVYINLGSAVIMPEVFLKAVSLVRNLGTPLRDLTTLNMDFIKQYRPVTNVVERPTREGGRGFTLVGHHEIMFPLLVAAVLEACNVG